MIKGLYAITPSNLSLDTLVKKTELLLKRGLKLIQYRDKNLDKKMLQKNAKYLLELTKEFEAKLIINDHIDVCIDVGADGFHLGFEDYLKKENLSLINKNKELINNKLLCGLSCKWNKELVINPPEDLLKWDYLAVGAFYFSKTKKSKPEKNDEIKKKFLSYTEKPLVAIGGINNNNINEIMKMGYTCFATSEAIFKSDPSPLFEKVYKNL